MQVSTNVEVNRTAFLFCEAYVNGNFDVNYVWKFEGRVIDYRIQKEFFQVCCT